MAEPSNWSFPQQLQPQAADLGYDLKAVLDAMVMVRAEIPEDAFTAGILGTDRVGNGAVIREDGLVLTIGYLITEATNVWLTTNNGKAVAAHPLAYDQVTGFGLVQALGRLDVPALERGTARTCSVGDDVVVAGYGGRAHALKAKVAAKREFAGYWEYVLDEALFTAPAHPQWGGTALIDQDGKLIGTGSLLVQESFGGKYDQGNMLVPIDLLEPILDDMLRMGRPNRPARPWLGLYASEVEGRLVVVGMAANGPADKAGVQLGDIVHEVAGERVSSLADLFRKIWKLGQSGVEVPLTLSRKGAVQRLKLRSADRSDFLKKPHLH